MTPSPRQIAPSTATAPSGRAMVRDVGAGPACRPGSTSARRSTSRSAWPSEVGEHDELPDEDRRWLERARAALPDRVRPAIDYELCIFGAGPDRRPPRGRRTRPAFVGPAPADAGARLRRRRARRPAARPGARGRDRRPRSTATGPRSTPSSPAWPEHKHGWLSRHPRATRTRSSARSRTCMEAWLPLYQEIEPRVAHDHRARRRRSAPATAPRSARRT